MTRTVPLALAALALSLAACDSRQPAGKAEPAAAAPTRYTVRAELVALPEPGARVREVELRHEAIDDFRDGSGAVVGMDAMVMPFALEPGVSLDGVGLGDAVEVVLAVDFGRPMLRVERLRKLPAGTALTFGKARPGVAGR